MATSENLFPDLHMKMSKKIAQLTKVIYHLNSKNEDHQDDLTSLTDAYETEIDQILKDAYTKINKFKDMIDQRKEVEKQQQAVDEFKKQHESEKKEALAAFEALKTQVKEREEQLRRAYDEKLQNAIKELDAQKAEFKKRIDEFNAAVRKMEASGGAQAEDLLKKHKKETSDLVKESNKKYNEMLKERLDAEEELRRQLEGALAKAKKDAEADTLSRIEKARKEADMSKLEELEKVIACIRSMRNTETHVSACNMCRRQRKKHDMYSGFARVEFCATD